MSFKLKLFLTFILFGVFLSFFSIYTFSHFSNENQIKNEKEIANALLNRKEEIISQFIEDIDAYLYSIANNTIFKDFTKNGREKKYIHELFQTVLLSKKSIQQIRYISHDGKEQVRIDKLVNTSIIKKENELLDKSSRYYFQEIKKQAINTIWHSKMDLNIEHGIIEKPLNPVLRVALNLKNGFLILNISLKEIITVLKNRHYELFLVDKNADVIIDSKAKHSWSAYLESDFKLINYLAQNSIFFLSKESYTNDKFTTIKIKAKNADGAVLILKYPENLASTIHKKMFITYVTIFISTLILAIFLALIFSRPISKLTQKIENLNKKLEKKVKERTAELENSLNTINKYVIHSTTDLKGNIIDASDAFCKVSKYTKDELIGKPHSIVRHPDMPKSAYKQLWKTIKEGKSWQGKVKNLAKDGSSYWVEAFIEPLYDKNKKIIAYSAIRNNITDKILLESQIEQNQAIIKFAASAIGTIDLEGNFLSTNNVYTKIFGYTQEEMNGKNCVDMSTEEYKNTALNALKIANSLGVITQVEKKCYTKSHEEITIDMSLNMLPDKKSFVVIVNSLEDKKKLEELNKSLENKVKEEVAKNTKQLEMIQQEQLKSVKLSSIGALAAGITHEINTPLTYIKGNFELLKSDVLNLPQTDSKDIMIEDITIITEGLNRIANIVEAMREVSQASSESKSIVNIYSTLLTSLTISYNKSKLISKIYINGELFTMDMDKNKIVYNVNIQKQRVEQVWIVIISNALDELLSIANYEERKLEIIIEQEESFVVIKFKDNGGGIAENIIDTIFEPFVSNKEHSGIGIGLNIAKQIVEEQKGELKAYNENNCAVFEVKLQLA